VRRHRVSVIALVSAALALAIGGGISISRVLAARGTAEVALAEAVRDRDRADNALAEMTFEQARSLLATNPTAAVALVKTYAGSPRWQKVRAIAEEARARGVCWGLPGPLAPAALTFGPGGDLLASTDLDGGVWIHDLARRTSRELVHLARNQTRVTFADAAVPLAARAPARCRRHGALARHADQRDRGARHRPRHLAVTALATCVGASRHTPRACGSASRARCRATLRCPRSPERNPDPERQVRRVSTPWPRPSPAGSGTRRPA